MLRLGPVLPDGSLAESAITLLHAVSGVDETLLRAARIRPSKANWLRAPWYPYHQGGALTIGRTIWFTRKWFAPNGLGDESIDSTRRWLLHLAHEVGHLPQAERFGQSLLGKVRYVAAFTWQYTSRAALLHKPIHDGSPLEREADKGRQVLAQLLEGPDAAALLAAVHRRDTAALVAWCQPRTQKIRELTQAYEAKLFA